MRPDDRVEDAVSEYERDRAVARARWEAHEARQRRELLLAFIVVPLATVVLIATAPASYRPWLVLALVTWLLVGFVVEKGSGEPTRKALLWAPVAPFAILLYSPFMLFGAKDAWRLRRLRAQIRRIGTEGVRIDGISEGTLHLYDVRPGETNFDWNGRADEALSRLRSVPDDAGRDALWEAFPERTTPPFRALNAELERIWGGRAASVEYLFKMSVDGDPIRVFEPAWDDEAPPPEIAWEWGGTVEEALERLRLVPDGSGRDGLWRAFPDKLRDLRRELDAEIERILGAEGARVHASYPRVGRARLRDIVYAAGPRWAWEGTSEVALERLGGIRDGAGRDGVWEAFPDKVRAPDERW